ncbi:siderophore-interacting protein [Kocuria coralli]|uniref:Siderophore-interacting protein n=1 Tax=Kocuria coralli TaxID=1461025 RepID=A0A5J5KYV8_9MICC|nr:siderophore-interacting protein [Kocuria coralli]KAA9394854.1 siderophore-interacting protein [Kocuria coralli]
MSRPSTGAFEAEVIAVEDLSPSFRRITFGGGGMEDFGIPHHPRDQRLKMIIPPRGDSPAFDLPGFLAEQEESGISWYQAWLQLDPSVRGTMRTYTVREWRDAPRELVVDMVLHTDDDGHSGPASRWALEAEPGSRLHVLGPSRHGEPTLGGIEFDPGNARHILLVGDETAVPAIASILDHIQDAEVTGQAVLEVPTEADIQELPGPAGLEVVWLPRGDAPVGSLIEPAVRRAVSAERVSAPGSDTATEIEDVDIDRGILWEVPAALTNAAHDSGSDAEARERPFYAWIAGEAAVVKSLRRYLVRDIGVDRGQVAFMGYWRSGRAEGE